MGKFFEDCAPCPHCRGDAEVRESVSDAYVACNVCGCRTGMVYLGASDASNAAKIREAIDVWNRRPDSPTERT